MSKTFPFIKQPDAMDCGVCCLKMIATFYNRNYEIDTLRKYASMNVDGVSLLGISKAAEQLGFKTMGGFISIRNLITNGVLPCVLHWTQNHFVVLYRIKNGKKFFVADPGKGLITYSLEEFKHHWLSTIANEEERGVALFLQPTSAFYDRKDDSTDDQRTFSFLFRYIKQYKKFFGHIILGLFVGCILQLIFPFLTQSIVDVGITHKDLNFIWLVLLGQIVLTFSRTIIEFIRRWLLLHISMRVNISIVSDFFIKLLKLPMSFFDTKLMGDLLQRMHDHSRVEKFLTNQMLTVMFSILSFLILGTVLFIYNKLIFGIFIVGSIAYGVWTAFFLNKRRSLDYELFDKQAKNNNYTYIFVWHLVLVKQINKYF